MGYMINAYKFQNDWIESLKILSPTTQNMTYGKTQNSDVSTEFFTDKIFP